MFIEKEYLDKWMQRILDRLDNIESYCSRNEQPPQILLPDGDRLLDNYDLCKMLNVSKRSLQRYRSMGELEYEIIHKKTYYRESKVLEFIEKNFSNFRNLKQKGR